MRAAARLKLAPSAATSSRPLSSTRWFSAPPPKASTPCCSAASRRVSRRATGQAPAATAANSTSSRAASPTPSGKPARPGTPGKPAAGRPIIGPPGGPRSTGGRSTHKVRPSSRRTACGRSGRSPPAAGGRAASRRRKLSDAAMRWPSAPSSAIGRRRRSDHSRNAAACSATGASTSGSERCRSSPQAAMRSCATPSRCMRWSSRWLRMNSPDTSANSASATTTVR